MKQIVEIPVQALRKGLYVSRLDRPWSESPFLFQGFEIENDEELSQLKSLCRRVYVEVSVEEAEELRERGKHAAVRTGASESAATKQSAAHLASLKELSQNINALQHRVPAQDPVALKTELAQVKGAYGEARSTVVEIFDRLKRGGGLEVQLVESAVDSMVESIFRNREAVGWLARMKDKDNYLYRHSLASSVWALVFGRHLGLDKDTLRSLGVGAMLLDIGKTQVPTALLHKNSAPDHDEWQTLQRHVEFGMKMLDAEPRADSTVKTMLHTHHERNDGSGYPRQLAGEEIPLVGRIAGIVDCYDAMTSDRSFAKGKSTYEAVRELNKLGKSWFQPELVELFIQAVGVFPTGTLVELNTGEVAIVITQNRFRRLRPQIMLIMDKQKKVRDEFPTVDLQLCASDNDAGNRALWIAQGLEAGAYGIDPTEFFL